MNGKLATVHLEYGTGIEAPVSIICVTHLVANPGPFTVHVTSGTLTMPFLGHCRCRRPAGTSPGRSTPAARSRFPVAASSFRTSRSTRLPTATASSAARVRKHVVHVHRHQRIHRSGRLGRHARQRELDRRRLCEHHVHRDRTIARRVHSALLGHVQLRLRGEPDSAHPEHGSARRRVLAVDRSRDALNGPQHTVTRRLQPRDAQTPSRSCSRS